MQSTPSVYQSSSMNKGLAIHRALDTATMLAARLRLS